MWAKRMRKENHSKESDNANGIIKIYYKILIIKECLKEKKIMSEVQLGVMV